MMLDFTKSARQVFNHIRGLSPVPLAFSSVNGKTVKIVSASIACENGNCGLPGKVIQTSSKGFTVACGEGSILVTVVVPEGRKKMDASAFVNGRGIALGDILGFENN